MLFLFRLFLLSLFLLSGCATPVKTIKVGDIKNNDTIVYGKIELVKQVVRSGRLVTMENVVPEKGSLFVRKFNNIEELPNRHLNAANLERLFTDKDGMLLVPLPAGNYCLAMVFAELEGFGRAFWLDFSKGLDGVNSTLYFSVKDKAVNYIGDVKIVYSVESYEDSDSNDDGYIDVSEFKSNLTDFYSVSDGKEKFHALTQWHAASITIDDSIQKIESPIPQINSLSSKMRFR